MLIRLIYEDEKIVNIKDAIKDLDSKQLYFVEDYIRKIKMTKKQEVFDEWKKVLHDTLEEKVNN